MIAARRPWGTLYAALRAAKKLQLFDPALFYISEAYSRLWTRRARQGPRSNVRSRLRNPTSTQAVLLFRCGP